MRENISESQSLAASFGLSSAPLLVTKPVKDAEFSIAHLVRPLLPDASQLVCLPRQNCFFMLLYLDDTRHCDVAPDGLESKIRLYPKGSICVVDLAEGATIRLHETLHALAFLIPYRLLDEVSTFSKAPEARTLRCLRGQSDDVIWNMGKAMLPLFAQPHTQRSGVLGHLAVAICAHLLHIHGASASNATPGSDFSATHERAAKDFMVAHFGKALDPETVARAIGLSEAVFQRGFENATGRTPMDWLTGYRILQAKRYIDAREHTFEEVAKLAGFVDLEQLSYHFTAITGFSLQRWRNRSLN